MKTFSTIKTGYNYRTRKERDIMAFIYDANGVMLDAINPGIGNHRAALDWAEWRAASILADYPAAVRMEIHNGDTEIAVINFNTTTTPETPNPDNTPSTMNANETISAAIIAELNTRKDRSVWNKGVTAYAIELAESLDNWDKQPESVAELNEMMLNGADDWKAYSYGGSALIYNQDIAERLCSPSELKRVSNKFGNVRGYANARENWCDVQARALYQAANRVAEIANKFFNA